MNDSLPVLNENENFLSPVDLYLFDQGTHYEIYNKLGAHVCIRDGVEGVNFAVWAPNARNVCVIGDFNGWSIGANPLRKTADMGIFECFVPGAKGGQGYKYHIETPFGNHVYRSDPYGFWTEVRPSSASRIYEDRDYPWEDEKWISARGNVSAEDRPLAIYEVHIGSWRRDYSQDPENGFYNYIRFAHEITDYVREMGYTHVELMGIAEHPLDASWGYQVTNYYAPTSRHGSPDEFKYLVNYLHKNGIGVILDWVPAHFPKDEQGLANFDGYAVYEHADPRKGEHPDWGTKIFNYERPQVRNFLIANAMYWVEKYHVDGLRVDAVASMLYLDYGRGSDWIPNCFGGNENLDAIELLRHLNSMMGQRNPGVMMIAEDSTAWPKVTEAPQDGGLGFTYKWNMGWMHDFLEYIKEDPLFRKYHHNLMTHTLTYSFWENYILVLSHDEIVHLKRSMLEKFPGDDYAKFESLKTAYTFMLGHPGKKLLFMGNEFGQRREWSEARDLDWYVLDDPRHYYLREYVKSLLKIYNDYPAVSTRDKNPMTFDWINGIDAPRSIFSFVRWDPSGENNLLFICNFTPLTRHDYRVGVPREGKYEVILNSAYENRKGLVLEAQKQECDGREYSIGLPLAGFESVILKF